MIDDYIYVPRENKSQRIAVSTTAARTALLSRVMGVGYIRVTAVGANVDLQFGPSTVTVPTLNSTSADDDGACAPTLLSGQWQDFYITNETHVAWDASGDGHLVITRAGREGR